MRRCGDGNLFFWRGYAAYDLNWNPHFLACRLVTAVVLIVLFLSCDVVVFAALLFVVIE